jgi:hypothetical protein
MIFSLLLMVIIEEYIKNQTKIKVKTFKIRYKMHLNILEVMNKLIIRELNQMKCEQNKIQIKHTNPNLK